MSDPLGLISTTTAAPFGPARPAWNRGTPSPDFKEALRLELARVNELQMDAKEAVEDLAAGRRDDVEGVIVATQKADLAFRMLLQVRNKMMDAYEEVKQIRV